MSGVAELLPWLGDAALKATVVLGLALMADAALRRSSAAARHLVWTVAVAGMLVIPVASPTLPALEAGLWPRLGPTASGETARPGTEEVEEFLRQDASFAGRAETGIPGSDDLTALPLTEGASPIRSPDAASSGVGGAEGAAEMGAGSGEKSSAVLPAPMPGPGPGDWGMAAVLVWILGAVAVLVALVGERVLCLVSAHRGETFGPGRVRSRARDMAQRMGLSRVPRLLRLEGPSMPATWGVFRHTVALPAAAERWSDGRLESVLAHELAHVRRRDCGVQTAAVLACALYWFHPLAWVAAARLRRERELAADDEVLALGTRPSSYARELLTLAASTSRPGLAVTATAMAAEEGLPRRIRSVVAARGRRGRITRSLARRAAGVGALVVLPLAVLAPGSAGGADLHDTTGTSPGMAVGRQERGIRGMDAGSGEASRIGLNGPEECWRPDVPHSMRVQATDDRHELDWSSDGCESEILVDGEVAFTRDFSDVEALSADGVLRVEEETDEYRRSVEYRSGSTGGTRRTFRRDGQIVDPTTDEERWIRERLTTVLRQTGIAAGERVAWILGRSGPDGVLGELEWISADGPAGRYMTELLDRAGLDEAQLRRFLNLGGERIGSDGVLSEVLVRTVEEYPGPVTGPARGAFRDAAGTVGSDGSLGSLLRELVASSSDGPEGVGVALDLAAESIGSDGEMARLLRQVVDSHPATVAGRHRDAFLAAARTVGSDGSLGSVVEAMLTTGSTSEEMVSVALEASRSIGSDGQMARFLVRVVETHPALVRPGGPLAGPFERALATVGSDGEEVRVRRALRVAAAGAR